eukprot:3578319-Alexandrium_andersonii.AAC.1
MSASLVGSEMCIRDSSPVAALGCDSADVSVMLGSGEPSHSITCDRRTESVSYTHLTLPTICSV